MTQNPLSRRLFLTRSLALGCSLAASPLVTPVTMASAPGENRLVVIILRGGLDGLDAVRPIGAPEFAGYRRAIIAQEPEATDLDGYFALHPALQGLMPLWRAGQLSFAHAVSTPYRDKRSHFDGQDILEAGTGGAGFEHARDGWLNRMLAGMPDAHAETAYAIGRQSMLLTRGAADVADWSPEASLVLSPQAGRLLDLVMHDDPLFRDALSEALSLSQDEALALSQEGEVDAAAMLNTMQAAKPRGRSDGLAEIARFAASRLKGESRIAAYSMAGFDTHAQQTRNIRKSLGALANNILILREELGPIWDRTTVVAMTEFGRTVRANGTAGTDHGTGGLMVMAGGALRGGTVVTDWPGLEEAALFQRRDLMPTRDVRAHTGWLLRGLFGVDRSVVERTIFPGVELGPDPGLLL